MHGPNDGKDQNYINIIAGIVVLTFAVYVVIVLYTYGNAHTEKDMEKGYDVFKISSIVLLCVIIIALIMSVVIKTTPDDTNNSGITTKNQPSVGITTKNQPFVGITTNSRKISEFPKDTDDIVFSIQYKNSTDIDIMVWLDDQPFCKKDSSDAPCRQGTPILQSTGWENNLGTFYVISNINGVWQTKKTQPARKQLLKPSEIWRIVPPTGEDGKPYWCFDQNSPICFDASNVPSWCEDPDYKTRRQCPGVGAWITPADKTMPAIKEVTKFEYNINNGELWFDVSSVDGINVNTVATYTGCPDKQKKCTIDLKTCPVSSVVDGVKTCPSPKTWPDIDKCGNDGYGNGLSAGMLAGCGYGATLEKEECHKWWANNKCAQQWLNWLQKNPSGETCDQYGWAYNETVFGYGDSFDSNFNPCVTDSNGKCIKTHNNPIEPLIRCPINKGSLNIDILNILH